MNINTIGNRFYYLKNDLLPTETKIIIVNLINIKKSNRALLKKKNQIEPKNSSNNFFTYSN